MKINTSMNNQKFLILVLLVILQLALATPLTASPIDIPVNSFMHKVMDIKPLLYQNIRIETRIGDSLEVTTKKFAVVNINNTFSKNLKEMEEEQKYQEMMAKPRPRANRNQDLANFKPVTADQMNYIIDSFCDYKNENIPFKGHGDYFIKASEVSGLNPVYLFAHASLETGYGTSPMAVKKGNYFGIAAYDHDPSQAYYMGDTMEDGLINGALWIKDNFYNKGQTSLHGMIYDGPFYASAGDDWINDILWIMNKFPIS